MTSRGVGLAGAAVALWIAARAFGIDELQMAAAGALCLLTGAAIWVWVRPVRVATERLVWPANLPFDDVADVDVRLKNEGRLRTPHLYITDRVSPALGENGTFLLSPVPAGKEVTFSYQIQGSRRGQHLLGPARTFVNDPFGLIQRTRRVGTATVVTVYPRMVPLADGLALGGASNTERDGQRRRVASGDDLADVREYVRGDDLRAVHWPSTAHRGKLMVRRNEGTNAPAVVVLLDRQAERYAAWAASDGANRDSFEVAVSTAASISQHLASRERTVTLLDEPVRKRLPTRTFPGHLSHLATIQPAAIDFHGLLRQIADGVASDGTLITIVTAPSAQDLQLLVRAGRGFSSRAALLLPTDHEKADIPIEQAAANLKAAGWHTAIIDTTIEQAWQQLLARPVART